jgi:molybdopterin-guanine dinucleotide biosynthesis protein
MRPLSIGIGGAHSGSGKTEVASLLLQRLRGWGAIKYTKTELYCSIIDDPYILSMEGKDTRRLLDSGAARVLWLKSPPHDLSNVLQLSIDRLSDLKGIVVEGNSAIEFMKPDIIIFISGNNTERIKESAERILGMAHAVVIGERQSISLPEGVKRFDKSPEGKDRLVHYIEEMVAMKEKIRLLLQERATDRKIPCAIARKIAEELGVSYREIGNAANELNIKIIACELGCF